MLLRSLLLCVALLDPPAAEPQSSDRDVETAKALVAELEAGDYPAAVDSFDDVMRKGLPADKLQQAWEQGVIRQYGSLKQSARTRTEKAGSYDVVYVTCEFERGKLDVKVVLTGDGKVAGLFFVPSGRYESPPYVDRTKFDEIDVTIGEGLWKLPGTLSLPKGEQRFPAAILVHGSGPQDRDSTIGPNKPFRDLAHGLASQGIAVLRYEKRTKHHSLAMSLLPIGITTKEEAVDDAAAAVQVLKSHEKIDPSRIYVLGHSLGGTLIPRIAIADDEIAGFISLAGSTLPLEDVILEQTRYLSKLDGEVDEEEASAIERLEAQVVRVKSADLTKKVARTELPLGVPATYWLDLRGYDPPESAKQIQKPMLFLHGERDYQVTKSDSARWEAALSSKDDVRFLSYPKLNHLFVEGEGQSSPAEYSSPGNVAQAVIDDIAAWIGEPVGE